MVASRYLDVLVEVEIINKYLCLGDSERINWIQGLYVISTRRDLDEEKKDLS
jgi:hypothetical protein